MVFLLSPFPYVGGDQCYIYLDWCGVECMASGMAVVLFSSNLAFPCECNLQKEAQLFCLPGVCYVGLFMSGVLWEVLASRLGGLFDDPSVLFPDCMVPGQGEKGGGIP